MIRARLPWAVLAALLMALLSIVRGVHLDAVIGGYTSCSDCFLWPAFGHDAWLIALVCLLLGAAVATGTAWIRTGAAVVATVLIVVFAIDVELLYLFNQRFYVADLLHFSSDLAAEWSVARAQFFAPGGIVHLAFALTIAIVSGGLVARQRRSPAQARVLLVVAAALALFAAFSLRQPLRSVHGSYVANVVEANRPPGRVRALPPAFAAAQARTADALPQTCTQGVATGRSIVLVVVESLSAYQSALLGGPRDWLPKLDAIARGNHYFTRFYANGFTTDGGEIALLTGRVPLIPPGSEWYSLEAFGPDAATLPAILHRAGYRAHYFTATDLSFLGSGAWLRRLGFDTVEGNEAPFYAGMPRTQFGAADDAVLFARFERWLDEHEAGGPFAAVLLTISSHPPFVDPRTGKTDPAGSFGYVDAALAAFYERLRARGFLDHGLLLITGDHRSMTPLLADEYRRFGERAFARVPLVVAGAVDLPPVIDAPFQQADLPASVAAIVGDRYCRGAFNGMLFGTEPAPARYIVHARGDDRDRVDVYFDDAVASYREDGADSAWQGPVQPPDAAAVAAWINSQRVRNTPPQQPQPR